MFLEHRLTLLQAATGPFQVDAASLTQWLWNISLLIWHTTQPIAIVATCLRLHAGGGQQGQGVIDGIKSLAGGGDQGQSVKELSDDKWGGK